MVASLDLLFLILLHLIPGLTLGSSVCPYNLLESAFKVQVDLERKDGGEMIQLCSEKEKTVVGNLLQKGIEKASIKLAKNPKLSSFGASVCKAPTSKAKTSSRRQLATFDESDNEDERNLRSRTQFFRYYGTMRCRLCEKDNGDGRKFPAKSYRESMTREYDEVNRTYLGQISFNEKRTLEKIEVEFPLFGLQRRQDVILTINGKYKFILGHDQFRKVPVTKRIDDGFEWKITPLKNDKSRNYKVTLDIKGIPYQHNPLWTNIVKKHGVDVQVSFGGGKKLTIPNIFAFTIQYSAWPVADYDRICFIHSVASPPKNKKQGRAAVDSAPFFSPVASPSSPTAPAMSPVLSPQPKSRRLVLAPRAARAPRPGRGGPNNRFGGGKKSFPRGGGGGVPKNVSVSNKEEFKTRVYEILMCELNQDLNLLLPVGHCMYGKEIYAQVQLTSKPEWEKKLPTCSRKG